VKRLSNGKRSRVPEEEDILRKKKKRHLRKYDDTRLWDEIDDENDLEDIEESDYYQDWGKDN
jgi:hypothetical protein